MAVLPCQNCSGEPQWQQERTDTMVNPISSLLLVLGGKSLLNWAIVGLQKQHMSRSFLGFFCVSLTVIDTLLFLLFSLIYCLEDFCFLGFRLTKYHICLLVQIACYTYGILHWPVFILAGLDYYWTLPRPGQTHWAWKLAYGVAVFVVWILALLYVFCSSVFYPEVDDSFHLLLYECFISTSTQCFSLSLGLLCLLCCILVYCLPEFVISYKTVKYMTWTGQPISNLPETMARGVRQSKKHVLGKLTVCFLSTWTPFVCLQVVIVLLGAEIPAYLDMNVPWLCFLNSFLIGGVYWSQYQVFKDQKSLSFPDGFCSWNSSPFPRDSEIAPDAELSTSLKAETP
uniref:G protein-coupled receptor 160 n=1 Tax=Lepisosteus oculatus TaxID=7918 RepID=W5NLK0_LEPOC|nr:PREDICTED: probable G-protein coupled receptor 160 [Lepisosteus oculatus]XP_015216672.1 PREDICTED: probable G-protein coupled receptor 160 [Lepisosteus oculatus]